MCRCALRSCVTANKKVVTIRVQARSYTVEGNGARTVEGAGDTKSLKAERSLLAVSGFYISRNIILARLLCVYLLHNLQLISADSSGEGEGRTTRAACSRQNVICQLSHSNNY